PRARAVARVRADHAGVVVGRLDGLARRAVGRAPQRAPPARRHGVPPARRRARLLRHGVGALDAPRCSAFPGPCPSRDSYLNSASAPATARYALRLNARPTWLPVTSTLRAYGTTHASH